MRSYILNVRLKACWLKYEINHFKAQAIIQSKIHDKLLICTLFKQNLFFSLHFMLFDTHKIFSHNKKKMDFKMTEEIVTQSNLDTKTRVKSILGGSAGNLVEWYDWYVYAAFTLYFAHAFFPQGSQTAQLLQAAAIFAVGFLMRPIGAWIMGIYSDKKGRKSGLTLSVTLMCIGSLMIAISPTHDQIGILAPIILVVARLIQGLSVGGEYGASATYLSEMADRDRRGFFQAFNM